MVQALIRMNKVLPVLLVTLGLSAPAAGQTEESGVQVELNKLELHDGACRAYLVLENETDSAFDSLKLDLVMFDSDGVVAKRLAVEAAPLPAGKTSLKVFDMRDLTCDRVGRLLLNAVMTCSDTAGARENCLEMVTPSARGSTPFIK